MPTAAMSLSKTTRYFTAHMKDFELGTITESNPSDGVWRYTFADGSSPNTWANVMTARAGDEVGNYSVRAGINIAHWQLNNYTGATDMYNTSPLAMLYASDTPKTDSIVSESGTSYQLPRSRNTETSSNFANFLGDTTYGTAYAIVWSPNGGRNPTSSRTINTSSRYVEINWNSIATIESTYTTTQRVYGRTAAARTKIAFQPYVYFDTLDYKSPSFNFAVYYGKPRFYNTTISGSSLATLRSSPPGEVSNFQYPGGSAGGYSSTRQFTWTEPNSNNMLPYIYLYKWNGSAWAYVRVSNGDGYDAYTADFSSRPSTWNQYTIPSGDGSGFFYIYVYAYDGYYAAFSASGAGSNYISV